MFLPKDAPNIFSADMLRSGSTHIQMGLCNILSWRPVSIAALHGEGSGEQNVNPVTFSILAPYGYQVIGGHHVAYPDLLLYLRSFKMKPIVTIRNLYDTMVSIKDRVDQTWPSRMMPGLYIPMDWVRWSDEEQYTWLAHNAVPFQVKFLASWITADTEKLWVKYEEFYADQRAGFQRILDYYGLPQPSEERLEFAVSQKNNNFNKGLTGRGASLPRHVKRIIDAQVTTWGRDLEREIRGKVYA